MKQIISSFCIPQHLQWLTHSILDLTDGISSLLGYSGICHKHSQEKHQQLRVQILGKMVSVHVADKIKIYCLQNLAINQQ
jgi:hypothetical protein